MELKQSGLFQTGFQVVEKANEEAKRRQQEAKANFGKIWNLFLREEDGAVPVRFLTHEPLCYREHQYQNKEGNWVTTPCQGHGCELCARGERSRQVGAFLVAVLLPYESKEYDENGNDTGNKIEHEFSVRVFVRGMKDCTRLGTLAQRKGGLSENVYLVQRTGTQTNTLYSFDKENDYEDTDNPLFLGGAMTDEMLDLVYEELPEKFEGMDFEDILMAQYVTEEDEEEEEAEEPRAVRSASRTVSAPAVKPVAKPAVSAKKPQRVVRKVARK